MSKTDRYITVILAIGAFAGTLALGHWPRQRDGSAMVAPAAHSQLPRNAVLDSPSPGNTAPAAVPAAGAPLRRIAAARSADVTSTPSDSTAEAVMPVIVRMRRAGPSGALQAAVVNTSSAPVDVTLLHIDGATGTKEQMDLTLNPSAASSIDSVGWYLKHGDQILVRRPPLPDQEFAVP
jgi:hypothetical protein